MFSAQYVFYIQFFCKLDKSFILPVNPSGGSKEQHVVLEPLLIYNLMDCVVTHSLFLFSRHAVRIPQSTGSVEVLTRSLQEDYPHFLPSTLGSVSYHPTASLTGFSKCSRQPKELSTHRRLNVIPSSFLLGYISPFIYFPVR